MGCGPQFLKAAIDKAAAAGVAQERHHRGGVTNGEDEGSSAISLFNA
jgi:hypothetical protein